MDSQKPIQFIKQNARLAETNAVVWFLGFGVGGATGLALACAVFAISRGAPIWITIAATLIATVHASIIVFWLNRNAVRRRIALMVSMIASAILTCLLAWMIGSNGMQAAPLYGLAFMHLVMAFTHPANFTPSKKME